MGAGSNNANTPGNLMSRVHFIHPTKLKEKLPHLKNPRLNREFIRKLTCQHCPFVAHKYFGLERHMQQEHPDQYYEDESSRRHTRSSAAASGSAARRPRRRRRPAASNYNNDVRDEDEDHVVSDDHFSDLEEEGDRLSTPPKKKSKFREEDGGPEPLDEATWKALSTMPELNPKVVLLRERDIDTRTDNVSERKKIKQELNRKVSVAEFMEVVEEEEDVKKPLSPEFEQVLINDEMKDFKKKKSSSSSSSHNKSVEFVDLISDDEEEERVPQSIFVLS